ncbi:hypothetical protein [Deinococcus sp. QL22]|uniref:hypothetical protein n=1 Tax=Deinococcus sp. QL22 TaxID=2939437 RepID=UPI002017BC46|nr:hypothetical protein [Deinococcus sp. QL22]UQN05344.1 hypothetical protein M1R55_10680 [Deinococcus sp. QL22]
MSFQALLEALLPYATATAAIIGVLLTIIYNGILKTREFNRQEETLNRQRIQASGDKSMESLASLNKTYVNFLKKNESSLNDIISILEAAHANKVMPAEQIHKILLIASEYDEKTYSWINSEEFRGLNTALESTIILEMNHSIVWFNDEPFIKYKNDLLVSSKETHNKLYSLYFKIHIFFQKQSIENAITFPDLIESIMDISNSLQKEAKECLLATKDEISKLETGTSQLIAHIKAEYDAVGKSKKKKPRLPWGRRG